MKKIDYHLIFFLFLVTSRLTLEAQEHTLHFNRDLIQSSHTNPAFRYDYKFSFLFPSVAFNFGNNAFSFDDLLQDHPTYDSTYLDIDGVIDQMEENNLLQVQSKIDVFGLYYSHRNWFFSFFLTEKFDFRFSYPKDLVDLIWNGNAKFLGETIEIGPGIMINYYKELNFGIGRRINDKWDVGMKFKLLDGISNVSSLKDDLFLTTEEDDYATTLSADYEIRTSGVDNPLSNFLKLPTRFQNPGFAFDLGAVYRLNNKWEFSQSILDLGRIRWKNNVKSYNSKGSFTYTGVDLAEFIDDQEVYFDKFRDSLKDLYFKEETGGAYQVNLIPETFTGAMFRPDDKTHIGAMLNFRFFSGIQFGMSLYAGRQLLKIVNLGLSYNIKNRQYDNVGLNLNIGPPAFKIFLVTDNFFTAINFRRGKNIAWRYGINVNIGKAGENKKIKKDQSEPEIPDTGKS